MTTTNLLRRHSQRVSFPKRLQETRFKTVTEAGENLMSQYPTTNIQKVNYSLCEMAIINFEMNYEPRVASFGPIHHGTPKYQLGEKYKLILTYEFIRGGGNDILNTIYSFLCFIFKFL